MNQPITADATAMIVPARNALTMNGNDHNCRMSATTFQVGPSAMMHPADRRVRPTDHDQTLIAGAQHLDRRAVQATERGTGDDLFRRTGHRTTARDVDDPVQVTQDR